MMFSVLTPSILHLAGLRLLCAIGGCAGFMVVLLGLRLERNRRCSSQGSRPESTEANSAPQSATAQSLAQPEVIHLSKATGPARSSEMTQQQKIAAALSRAGMANSGWSQPEIQTATALLESPPESVTKSDHNPDAEALPSHAGFDRKLILLAGATLALLSIVL